MQIDLFERVAEYADRRAQDVVFQGISESGRQTLTYSQFARDVRQLGLFLRHSGVSSGDRLAILMEERPRWPVAFLAGYSVGAVLVPLDALQDANRLADILRHADCMFLIASDKYREQVNALKRDLPDLRVLMDGPPEGEEFAWQAALDSIRDDNAPFPLTRRDMDDDFTLLYTGGTTGAPKGVRLSERNIFSTIHDMIRVCPVGPQDHVLSILPLCHVMSLQANLLGPLYLGSKVTYLSTRDPQRVLASFREEQVTAFLCVPQFYYLVQRRILDEVGRKPRAVQAVFHGMLRFSGWLRRRWNLNLGRILFSKIHHPFGPRFRLFGVGGARFAPEVGQFLGDLGFDMFQAYGMTETSGPATVTPLSAKGGMSSGPAMASMEVRVADPDANGVGDILLRGDHVMLGYWKNPEATAAILRDGWLHTGDLGYLDSGNCLHITGRKKDVIVLSSGKNVFPEPLEHYLQSNSPLIQEACVLGIMQPSSLGEELHAVIVPSFDYLRSQQIANMQDEVRYELDRLSRGLPAYQRLHSFEVRTDPLPRTTTRKVRRFEVQQQLRSNSAAMDIAPGAVALLDASQLVLTAAEAEVFAIIQRMKKRAVVKREMNLELDLGFDSLERVELLANVQEAFGVHIADEAMPNIFTVGDLLAQVENRTATVSDWRSWKEILNEPLNTEEHEIAEIYLRRRPVLEPIIFVVWRGIYLLARLLFRLRFEVDSGIPADKPLILCANHASFLDVFLVTCGLPYPLFRRLFFLGATKYAKSPWQQWVWKIMRGLKVDADRNLTSALRLGAEGLRRGMALCVFPEGHRSVDGKLQPFKRSSAILAAELNVPLVPAAIEGSFEVWAPGSRSIRLHPVQIRVLAPIAPAPGESYDTLMQQVSDVIRRTLKEDSNSMPLPAEPAEMTEL